MGHAPASERGRCGEAGLAFSLAFGLRCRDAADDRDEAFQPSGAAGRTHGDGYRTERDGYRTHGDGYRTEREIHVGHLLSAAALASEPVGRVLPVSVCSRRPGHPVRPAWPPRAAARRSAQALADSGSSDSTTVDPTQAEPAQHSRLGSTGCRSRSRGRCGPACDNARSCRGDSRAGSMLGAEKEAGRRA